MEIFIQTNSFYVPQLQIKFSDMIYIKPCYYHTSITLGNEQYNDSSSSQNFKLELFKILCLLTA
jgi:hypothetical protein